MRLILVTAACLIFGIQASNSSSINPEQVDISFSAIVVGSISAKNWKYIDQGRMTSFRAYNFTRSRPYRYRGSRQMELFNAEHIPMQGEAVPSPTAVTRLPHGTTNILLIILPRSEESYDIFAVDAAPLGKITGGYMIFNLLSEDVQFRLGQKTVIIAAGKATLFESDGELASQAVQFRTLLQKPQSLFFSSSWRPQKDRAEIIIITPNGDDVPRVNTFPEILSNRESQLRELNSQ